MFNWFRQSTLEPLSVSMAGAKLGDRVLIIGCTDPRLIAALAAKAGLSGRACAVDPDADVVEKAGRIVLREGALVEASAAPLNALPFDADAFDLVILRDVLRDIDADPQPAVLQQAHRVVRPGGRIMAIETAARAGIFGAKATSQPSPAGEALTRAFASEGFAATRTLAERDGLIFVEGLKRNG